MTEIISTPKISEILLEEFMNQKLITIIKRPVPKPNEVNRRFKGKLYLIMRTFLTILVSVMLLLISVSAWANRLEDGIYEKKDADGRITAKMFVTVMSGYATQLDVLGRLNMTSTSYIIALQALDDEGNVTEELATNYSGKTPVAGAGESGIRLTGENNRNAQDFNKEFTPEVFSTSFGQQVEFDFREPGKANAYHCSDALDGEYVLNPDEQTITRFRLSCLHMNTRTILTVF